MWAFLCFVLSNWTIEDFWKIYRITSMKWHNFSFWIISLINTNAFTILACRWCKNKLPKMIIRVIWLIFMQTGNRLFCNDLYLGEIINNREQWHILEDVEKSPFIAVSAFSFDTEDASFKRISIFIIRRASYRPKLKVLESFTLL